MESAKNFEVGDMVEAYKRIIGWITYIDHKNETADVEWDEGNFDYTSMVVPFKYLEKVKE
jgi:hypothetical protein